VAIIPLESQEAAESAINNARQGLKNASGTAAGAESDESDVEDDADTASVASVEHEDEQGQNDDAAALEPPQGGVVKRSSTFAKNVMQNRGKYGRFAQRWFSKNGSKSDARRKQGLSGEEGLDPKQPGADAGDQVASTPSEVVSSSQNEEAGKKDGEEAEETKDDQQSSRPKSVIQSLKPRILRSARLFFSSGGFFFSYDHNISGTLMQKSTLSSNVPLWERFDGLVRYGT
jgi:hypothetical protein